MKTSNDEKVERRSQSFGRSLCNEFAHYVKVGANVVVVVVVAIQIVHLTVSCLITSVGERERESVVRRDVSTLGHYYGNLLDAAPCVENRAKMVCLSPYST